LDEKFLQSNCQAGELLFSEILDGAGDDDKDKDNDEDDD